MSLIESTQQHAPLASEEKSVDKLEIEMEEKEHMIKVDIPPDSTIELVEDKAQSASSATPSDEKLGVKKDEESKTPRRPKLNIKIPQILRKRSKERPPDKVSQIRNYRSGSIEILHNLNSSSLKYKVKAQTIEARKPIVRW